MILCCGEALIDMVPSKSVSGADAYEPCPGGSPYNSAIAIGRLGAASAFLSRLSSDFFGDQLVARLAANGVRTDLIARAPQPTTLAFVKIAAGKEPQYAFYTNDSADRSFSSGDVPPRLPEDTNALLFGSISLTMEPGASTIESLVQRESAARVVSFDPNIRPTMIADTTAYLSRFERWAGAATIVKISAADLEFLFPKLSLDAAIERLLSYGVDGASPRLVAVTLGAEGAMAVLAHRGRTIRATAPVVDLPVADTIGAGDTFHAAFLSFFELKGRLSREGLASLSEGELSEALAFANAAASVCCSRRGAEPPTMAELKPYLS